jgi:hypothetical protein
MALNEEQKPYRLYFGHWGITAWSPAVAERGNPGRLLAEVFFPVGNCGPIDPPPVRDRLLTELDAKARAVLGEGA